MKDVRLLCREKEARITRGWATGPGLAWLLTAYLVGLYGQPASLPSPQLTLADW